MSWLKRGQLLSLFLFGSLLIGRVAAGDDEKLGFRDWINKRIASEVAVAVSTRSNANQTEAPSVSGNATSLVDTSSASDLVGVALNAAGLTAGTADSKDAADATTGSATVSAFALYAAALGENPLNPAFYCGNGPLGSSALWRRLSFTLGFDDQNGQQKSGKQPIIAGTKAVLWPARDICAADFSAVQTAVTNAGVQAGNVFDRAEDDLYEMYNKGKRFKMLPDGLTKNDFINRIRKPADFDAILTSLTNEEQAALVSKTDIDPFVKLDAAAREAIDRFQKQPQFAVSFLTKQRESGGADDYRGEAVLDWGLNDRLMVTANASYELTREVMHDDQGGRIAGALQFQPFKDPLVGPKPFRVSLTGEATWMENMMPTYKGQVKVNLPIPRIEWLSGVEVPLSVTIANRSRLVDETEVRGTIGFTVDTSQVLAALLRQPH